MPGPRWSQATSWPISNPAKPSAASAICRLIAELEADCGALLLERLPRGVVATEAGRLVAEHAQRQEDEATALTDRLRQLRGLQQGTVQIFCGAGFLPDLMENALAGFAREFPGIRYRIVLGTTDAITAAVAASNLITTTIGTYFTLFISLPLANFIYRTLEPMIGRKAVTGQPDASLSMNDAKEIEIGWGTMVGLLAIVAFIALVAGNWITYKTAPQAALAGTVIIVAVAALGAMLARFLPVKIPAVFWATLIGMVLTAPFWPGAHAITTLTGKMHFLALATVALTYAGMSLAKDIPLFKALGWRIVLVSLMANAGTFIFASLIAEFTLHS